MIALIVVGIIALICIIIRFKTSIKRIIKIYESGNVLVDGMRGTGKDMMTANVIARRKQAYISNLDYQCDKSPFIPLELDKLDIPDTFENFIENDIVEYNYPYPERSDIYLSDAGVYLPSQWFAKLEKLYPGLPVFQALSRHLGDCNFHLNSQNINRVWDKVREQADQYIHCVSCRVLPFRIVVQKVIVYDKYQSCVDRIKPYKPLPVPLIGKSEAKATVRSHNDELRVKYENDYGKVKKYTIIYRNKSKYNTRLFKDLLKVRKK